MNVLTHKPLPAAVMEISTGSGTCAGSPIVPTSLALQAPPSPCLMSHSFPANAAALIGQHWPITLAPLTAKQCLHNQGEGGAWSGRQRATIADPQQVRRRAA